MGAGVWGQSPQLGDKRTEILCIVRTNFNDDAQTSRTHLHRGRTYVDFNDVRTNVFFSLGRTNVDFFNFGRTNVGFLALGRTYVDFFNFGRTNVGFLALGRTYVDPNVGSH